MEPRWWRRPITRLQRLVTSTFELPPTRTSGKVELRPATTDAPMGGPKTSPTVFGCLRGSNMRPVVQVQLGEACRRLSACMAASLGIRDRHANARSTPLALWCVPGPNMRVVVPVQIGEACRRLSAGMAAALGIRVLVAFRWFVALACIAIAVCMFFPLVPCGDQRIVLWVRPARECLVLRVQPARSSCRTFLARFCKLFPLFPNARAAACASTGA